MSSEEKQETNAGDTPVHFNKLAETLESSGIPAALDFLAETLEAEKKFPQLFEALLMKKRHELGLPIEGSNSIREIPEEHRQEVEDYYVEVCRKIGGHFLSENKIGLAWPYFRAIEETDDIAAAISSWEPPEDWGEYNEDEEESDEDDLDGIIDVAFNQGAHPVRGYELILSHYGTCRAITTFEHQFPHQGEDREKCGKLLIDQLYGELLESLRNDIETTENEEAATEDNISALIADREWLFESLGYHVDISHLQSCIKAAGSLQDPETIRKATQMCDYGRRLGRDYQLAEPPPFEDFYNDYRILLRALAGEGVDGAARYYTAKVERNDPDEDGNNFPAEVLVFLLSKVGRPADALDVFVKYLREVPGPLAICPSLMELSRQAGDYSQLLSIAENKNDLLQFGQGLVQKESSAPNPES